MSKILDAATPNKSSDSFPQQRSVRAASWWVWPIAVLAIIGVAVFLFEQRQTTRSTTVKASPLPKGVPVAVATAHKGDVGVYINAIGSVTPVYTVTVTSRVQGAITHRCIGRA